MERVELTVTFARTPLMTARATPIEPGPGHTMLDAGGREVKALCVMLIFERLVEFLNCDCLPRR